MNVRPLKQQQQDKRFRTRITCLYQVNKYCFDIAAKSFCKCLYYQQKMALEYCFFVLGIFFLPLFFTTESIFLHIILTVRNSNREFCSGKKLDLNSF